MLTIALCLFGAAFGLLLAFAAFSHAYYQRLTCDTPVRSVFTSPVRFHGPTFAPVWKHTHHRADGPKTWKWWKFFSIVTHRCAAKPPVFGIEVKLYTRWGWTYIDIVLDRRIK